MSSVAHIFVASRRGAKMSSLTAVEALPGIGLAGDRYAETKNRRGPDYEVTLIELESIEGFIGATGRELTPEMPRRNIVTTGVRLNPLLGHQFQSGARSSKAWSFASLAVFSRRGRTGKCWPSFAARAAFEPESSSAAS